MIKTNDQEIADSLLVRVKSNVEKMTARLRANLDQVRKSAQSLSVIEKQLTETRSNREKLQSERNTIESASALGLHRLGFSSVEEAASKSADLTREDNDAAAVEERLEKQRRQEADNYKAAMQPMRGLAREITQAARLFSEGEYCSRLCAVASEPETLPYRFRHEFILNKTKVRELYDERLREIQERQPDGLLALLDTIVAMPIFALDQNPRLLPDDRNSELIKWLREQAKTMEPA